MLVKTHSLNLSIFSEACVLSPLLPKKKKSSYKHKFELCSFLLGGSNPVTVPQCRKDGVFRAPRVFRA